MVKHPSTVTIRMGRSQSTFQPPALCQDCGLEVASQDWSFRNSTPSLPLYGLHEPVYGLHELYYGLLRRAAGQERVAGRGRAVGGQDGLLG